MRTSLLPNLLAAIARNAELRPARRRPVRGRQRVPAPRRGGRRAADRTSSPTSRCGRPACSPGAARPHRRRRAVGRVRRQGARARRDPRGRRRRSPSRHRRRQRAVPPPGVRRAGELALDRRRRAARRRLVRRGPPRRPRAARRRRPAFAFELDLDALPLAPPAQMRPIAKFPGSARDVSLLLAEAIPAGARRAT